MNARTSRIPPSRRPFCAANARSRAVCRSVQRAASGTAAAAAGTRGGGAGAAATRAGPPAARAAMYAVCDQVRQAVAGARGTHKPLHRRGLPAAPGTLERRVPRLWIRVTSPVHTSALSTDEHSSSRPCARRPQSAWRTRPCNHTTSRHAARSTAYTKEMVMTARVLRMACPDKKNIFGTSTRPPFRIRISRANLQQTRAYKSASTE